MTTNADFAMTLTAIEASDPSAPHNAGTGDQDYTWRNTCIYLALHEASVLGIPCGIALDPQEPAWPVAYIELPTGQISWHLPAHPTEWDGHDGATKTQRITTWIETADTDDPANDYCCAMGNCLNCQPDPDDGELTIGQAMEQGQDVSEWFDTDGNLDGPEYHDDGPHWPLDAIIATATEETETR